MYFAWALGVYRVGVACVVLLTYQSNENLHFASLFPSQLVKGVYKPRFMGTPKTPPKHTNKRKKSDEKTRVHISLTPDLMRGMDFIAKRLFRNRVAFVEHAIINALASEGVTLTRILELADEWERSQVINGGESEPSEG